MDIDTKIKELQKDLERLEAELDSINRANYDGHETGTLKAKEKQIREKQSELLKYKKAKEMASIKDSMEILRLSGYTMDYSKEELRKYARQYGDPDLINHVEKLSPTSPEIGARIRWFKTYWDGRDINGKIVNKETARAEAKYKKMKDSCSSKDEYHLGDLGSYKINEVLGPGRGDKVIGEEKGRTPLEAQQNFLKKHPEYKNKNKNINASSPRLTSKDGYKMEDPKEIEAAIKKVKASGHPNPQYLSGLERALEIAKQERGMKDSFIRTMTSGQRPEFTIVVDDDGNYFIVNKYRRQVGGPYKTNQEAIRAKEAMETNDSCGEKIFTKGTEDSFGPYGAPFSYSDNFSIQLVAGGYQVEKNGKVIGKAKSYTEAKQIIQNNGGKIYPKGHTEDETIPLKEIIKNPRDPKIQATLRETYEQIKRGSSKDDDATKDAEEQWITMNGAHIKVEEGESKESAAKKFISSKGGSSNKSESKPKKEISKGVSSEDLELSKEEVSKIKQKFSKIKDPDSDTGSEYGHYVDAMRSQLRKKGKYPDMSELDDIKDKMWYMRQGGKKDTPEYKELEKQKNEWNKNFNKLEKEIKNKAYELSSPNEKKRLDEISSFFKKNSTNMGDSAKDACSNKDSAIEKECNEILKLSGFIS